MLYDPKWERPRPTLDGFAGWLETMPEDGRYVYISANCAIGQYLESIGLNHLDVINEYWDLFRGWNLDITKPQPRTFGAALLRARASLASQQREVG